MARMHELINELNLSESDIPESWDPYFIAAEQKYAQKADNHQRYLRPWYRQMNRWLSLENDHMDVLLETAAKILDNEYLYLWSSFVRYLIFDTKIIRNDESILPKLLPEIDLDEHADLFLAVTILAAGEEIVSEYKRKNFDGKEIEGAFSVIRKQMDHFDRLHERYGTAADYHLTHLAWAKLMVFEDIAFEYTESDLPGRIFRNTRSGEWVMAAKPGQLYDRAGRRLAPAIEKKLLERKDSEILLDESKLDEEVEDKIIKNAPSYPEGIWETRFFNTESGGFVANVLGPDGLAKSGMRIFEADYWEEVISPESSVLKAYPAVYDFEDAERFDRAVESAVLKLREHKREAEVLVVESWFMDERIHGQLEEDHPLLKQVKRFKLYPLPQTAKQCLEAVFGEVAFKHGPRLWPEDNLFQKIIKSLWLDGLKSGTAGGWLIPEVNEAEEAD